MFEFIDNIKRENQEEKNEIINKAVEQTMRKDINFRRYADAENIDLQRQIRIGVPLGSIAMEAISSAFMNRAAELDMDEISDELHIDEYQNREIATRYSDQAGAEIEEFTREHRERKAKKRKNHMKSSHKHADKLWNLARDHARIRGELGEMPEQSREYVKAYKEKIEIELEMFEEQYRMQMHALKIKGTKDGEEKSQLYLMRQICLMKKFSTLSKAIEAAEGLNGLLNPGKYISMRTKVANELMKLNQDNKEQLESDNKSILRRTGALQKEADRRAEEEERQRQEEEERKRQEEAERKLREEAERKRQAEARAEAERKRQAKDKEVQEVLLAKEETVNRMKEMYKAIPSEPQAGEAASEEAIAYDKKLMEERNKYHLNKDRHGSALKLARGKAKKDGVYNYDNNDYAEDFITLYTMNKVIKAGSLEGKVDANTTQIHTTYDNIQATEALAEAANRCHFTEDRLLITGGEGLGWITHIMGIDDIDKSITDQEVINAVIEEHLPRFNRSDDVTLDLPIFTRTTPYKSRTDYSNWEANLIILAKKGTRAVYRGKDEAADGRRECIIAPGTKLKLVKMERHVSEYEGDRRQWDMYFETVVEEEDVKKAERAGESESTLLIREFEEKNFKEVQSKSEKMLSDEKNATEMPSQMITVMMDHFAKVDAMNDKGEVKFELKNFVDKLQKLSTKADYVADYAFRNMADVYMLFLQNEKFLKYCNDMGGKAAEELFGSKDKENLVKALMAKAQWYSDIVYPAIEFARYCSFNKVDNSSTMERVNRDAYREYKKMRGGEKKLFFAHGKNAQGFMDANKTFHDTVKELITEDNAKDMEKLIKGEGEFPEMGLKQNQNFNFNIEDHLDAKVMEAFDILGLKYDASYKEFRRVLVKVAREESVDKASLRSDEKLTEEQMKEIEDNFKRKTAAIDILKSVYMDRRNMQA